MEDGVTASAPQVDLYQEYLEKENDPDDVEKESKVVTVGYNLIWGYREDSFEEVLFNLTLEEYRSITQLGRCWGSGRAFLADELVPTSPDWKNRVGMAGTWRAKERVKQDGAAKGVSMEKILGDFWDGVRDFGFYPTGNEEPAGEWHDPICVAKFPEGSRHEHWTWQATHVDGSRGFCGTEYT